MDTKTNFITKKEVRQIENNSNVVPLSFVKMIRKLNQQFSPNLINRQNKTVKSYIRENFPINPLATNLLDQVAAKQLEIIRLISCELGIEANNECQRILNCNTNELSKMAASSFIGYLQDFHFQQEFAIQQPLQMVS